MKPYRVLVEVLKPAFCWIEVNVTDPMDSIGAALEAVKYMEPSAFVECMELDPRPGLTANESIVVAPYALLVIDESNVQHYSRIDQIDMLRTMARVEAESHC